MKDLGRIGVGSATFGREINEATAFAVLDRAFAAGFRHIDTAAAYSAGTAERIVGAWLALRPERAAEVTVATKMRPPYDANAIAAAIGESRARLGVATIDIFYLHQWNEALTEPPAFAALDRAVREGTVGALGVSNFTAAQLERIVRLQREHGYVRVAVVQNNHNFAVRDINAALREVSAREKIAIVSYSPLGAGFLTGKHRGGVEPGSRFEVIPGHQNVYFNELAWARLAQLETVAVRTGHPLPLLALAWAFNQPGIACTLVGGRAPRHIDQAMQALDFDTRGWLAELERDDVRL